jgi:hypothetical protein
MLMGIDLGLRNMKSLLLITVNTGVFLTLHLELKLSLCSQKKEKKLKLFFHAEQKIELVLFQ